ncbi:lipopolysaccharide biosynthesis protein [Micromonospora vinacea]|uniref:O-antigen/teichoic acid export membrane protein n=1 Tax=Micromonospora vinacea TaxID=709878 RepID=A0ABS0K4L0_9ACTN|nr:lipopolysaccharide biosynthesis protein [Micromonospora vinacea]MBG6103485.1 O-antigen/teichoic acid export membrane protein [Micromonospora vinacea]WSZ73780.1 lipopolysaccharide biosynthesis protein [Micromonospora sp. NBC_00860]
MHRAAQDAGQGPDVDDRIVQAVAPQDSDRIRSRRLISGIGTAVLSRGTNVLVPLLLIPATLSYLGTDRYGLWMAVTALTGMVAFADLGLGNGLMTKLAPCLAAGDIERARRYVSSAYLVLGGTAGAITALLWLLGGRVPWDAVFNVTGAVSPAEARSISLICLTAFVVNVPLSLVNRVQYARQQVGLSNIWQGVGAGLALPFALAAIAAGMSATVVVAATVVGPVLVNVVNTVWTFGWRVPELAPWAGRATGRLTRELLGLGGLFFVLTIVMSMATNADTLIIAHRLGLESVTEYAVPARFVTQLGLLVTLVNVPLWAMNGDSLARGEVEWVRRTARRMTYVSVCCALVPTAGLVLVGDRLFFRWLGVPIGQDRWLLIGLAAWLVMLAAISPRFMVQNAAGVVRPQLLGWGLYLVLSVVAKWYGVGWYGISVVPYIGVGCYLLTVLPAALYGYRRALLLHSPAGAHRSNDRHDEKGRLDDHEAPLQVHG